uniref:Uncharacterized protein n=1 Tax=Lygus hesperus TaxID=30085 RepID=A0A0A9XN73_LYGHE
MTLPSSHIKDEIATMNRSLSHAASAANLVLARRAANKSTMSLSKVESGNMLPAAQISSRAPSRNVSRPNSRPNSRPTSRANSPSRPANNHNSNSSSNASFFSTTQNAAPTNTVDYAIKSSSFPVQGTLPLRTNMSPEDCKLG